MNIAQSLVQALAEAHIDHFFGVSGANIEPVFKYAHESGGQCVISKHEAAAVHMAEGYFRAQQKIAVVAVTSGGGAFNTLPGLAEARSSHIPLLVLVGLAPTSMEGRGAFQDTSGGWNTLETNDVFKSIALKTHKLSSSDNAALVIQQLTHIAYKERGPTVLLLPRDILMSDAGRATTYQADHAFSSMVNLEQIDVIETLMNNAKKLLFIGGENIAIEGYQTLFRDLVQSCSADLVLSPGAKGVMEQQYAGLRGVLGVMGHADATRAIEEATLIVNVGSRLDATTLGPGTREVFEGKSFIHIHHDASWLDVQKDFNCQSQYWLQQPRQVIKTLLERRQFKNKTKPNTGGKCRLESNRPDKAQKSSEPLNQSQAIKLIGSLIGPGDNCIVDAGNCGAGVVNELELPQACLFSLALGMGGMGHSFGAAIGACLGNGKRTWVFAGDGSYFMHGAELHTARELQLPITFIIFNNSSHAMCAVREDLVLGQRSLINNFKESNIGAGIRAQWSDMYAVDVQTENELKLAIDHRPADQPCLISMKLSSDEIPPFTPFTAIMNSKLEENSACKKKYKASKVSFELKT